MGTVAHRNSTQSVGSDLLDRSGLDYIERAGRIMVVRSAIHAGLAGYTAQTSILDLRRLLLNRESGSASIFVASSRSRTARLAFFSQGFTISWFVLRPLHGFLGYYWKTQTFWSCSDKGLSAELADFKRHRRSSLARP